MGLTIIIAIIAAIIISREAKEKGTYTSGTPLYGAFVGCLISLITIMPISAYMCADFMEEDSKIERKCIEQTEVPLEEFQPGVYIVAVMQNTRTGDRPRLSIKYNGETERVSWDRTVVFLNSTEAKMVIRKYEFKNPVLKFLFFNLEQAERSLFTPESMIYGEYDFNNTEQ